MITAQEAWEKTNSQEMLDDYIQIIEDGIYEKVNKGFTNVGIDFDGSVSSYIMDKIKDILEKNGFGVEVFYGIDGGKTFKISWEMKDGEET